MTPDETIAELRAENARLSGLLDRTAKAALIYHADVVEAYRLLHQCTMRRLGAEEGCQDWHGALDIVKAERDSALLKLAQAKIAMQTCYEDPAHDGGLSVQSFDGELIKAAIASIP